MECKREDRFRKNTIVFRVSDEEKAQVEARIILSGLPKGEYYRKSILGQEVTVVAGTYMSARVAKALEQILEYLQENDAKQEEVLKEMLIRLLEVNKKRNAPAGNRDISDTD